MLGTRYISFCLENSCTELATVRELSIDYALFFSDHGTCTFPSMTSLTQAGSETPNNRSCPSFLRGTCFRHCDRHCRHAVCLSERQAVLTKSSVSEPWFELSRHQTSLNPLTPLTNLEILKDISGCLLSDDVLKALKKMNFLTRLNAFSCRYMTTVARESITSISGFKALDAPHFIMHDFAENHRSTPPASAQLPHIGICRLGNGSWTNWLPYSAGPFELTCFL